MTLSPIEVELFRHRMAALCEEMGAVLRKSSSSANIKERRDYSCALYDADGQTVAMGDHMPVHLGAMPLAVAAVRETVTLEPGDVAVVNDPFRGGTHLPDITAVAAVFLRHRARPAFFVANRAHHADMGGMSPGSMPLAREIFQEGLRLPPVRLMKRGVIDEELLSVLLANVRTPEERRGDLRAQFAALDRGQQRLHSLASDLGARRLATLMAALQDYSERLMRATLAALPDGSYPFTDTLDPAAPGQPAPRIVVTVTIAGDRATIDFTGTSPQSDGPVNANEAITWAATGYVFRCLLPDDVPFTAGLLRPLTLVAPRGTLVNALPPAAMAAGNVETSQRITDVLLGALAGAAPDRMPAASSGTMSNISFGGWDPVRQQPFAYYETMAGGMGGGPRAPGHDAVHTHMTNSWNTPVEAFEHLYPVRVRRYGIRGGSGGDGHQPGGDGIVREFEFLAPAEVTLLCDRQGCGPYGLAGGQPGAAGRTMLERDGNTEALPGRVRLAVEAGDKIRRETPGGGGWGQESSAIMKACQERVRERSPA